MRRPRVLILGGDDRAQNLPWPKGYDLRFVGSQRNTGSPERRLRALIDGRKLDAIVILSRWISHSLNDLAKSATCKVVTWPQGLGELTDQLLEVVGLPPAPDSTDEAEEEWWAPVEDAMEASPLPDPEPAALEYGQAVRDLRAALTSRAAARAMLEEAEREVSKAVEAAHRTKMVLDRMFTEEMER